MQVPPVREAGESSGDDSDRCGYPGTVPTPPRSALPPLDFRGVRLHVVTGKGGTGKTTIAGALALALAAGGRKVLLVEVEGRQGIAQLFDTPPLPYGEHRIATAPGGGAVHALAIDPEAAMLEYLEMFYNIKRGGTVLKKVGAVDFATTVAPGLRDVLLTGKAGEAVRRKEGGRFVYDNVVLDSPPTGRVARFLTANNEVSDLARVGPIRNQADMVMRVIRSSQTAVHLVTLLEEMPVQETTEGIEELVRFALPVGAVIVNMARPALAGQDQGVDLATVPDAEFARALEAADLEWVAQDGATMTALRQEFEDHRIRVDMEARELAKLMALDRPVLALPWVPDGVDPGVLYEFAEELNEQGVAR
jgi:anion-transporting  ArsA/GET3 family ATPase